VGGGGGGGVFAGGAAGRRGGGGGGRRGGWGRGRRRRPRPGGDGPARHWHVDYLLGDDATGVATVVTTAADIECAVARRVADAVGGAVPDFGCSDCDCRSHLVGCDEREKLVAAVERAHDVVASESR